ncbi:MAG: cation diffusion facilitator family transporter [Salibacteraceae bacterium]
MTREQQIIRASWVGISVNGVLAILKLFGGYWFDSLAVIGDGLDSSNDVLTYIITFIAARIMMRPPDPKFPYGYNRVEAIATKLLSFFIFFVGAQLVYSSSIDLWKGTSSHIPHFGAVIITLFSVFTKLALSYVHMKQGKAIKSKMLVANAINMRNDIILSISVLVGVSLSIAFSLDWIDHLVALIVGLWILKVAFDLFKETSAELMDMVDDTFIYDQIFDAVDKVEGAHNPHRVRVRRLSNLIMIDIDIEVDPELPMKDVHKIGIQVEDEIKRNVDGVYDIMLHFEPIGNIENEEKFGVSLRPNL